MKITYEVFYLNVSACSAQEISEWLNQQLKNGYELVAVTGNWFIFKTVREHA